MKLREIIGLIIIVILALLLFKTCNDKSCPEVIPTIKVKVDTLKGDIIYVPVPVYTKVTPLVKEYQPKAIESINAPAEEYNIPEECPPVITSVYRDTLHFDSLGTVTVTDSVEGKILQRRLEFNLKKYTTTVTNNIYQKKKLKAFIGVEAIGNKSDVIGYYGANLSLQFKNDNIIQAGAGYWNNQLYYKAGIMFKIKIHK